MIASITSNKKSPVVGSTTYGKGIGQRFRLTPSLGLNSITSFRFFDKNDGNYHKYGIEPDFPINDRSSALEKAIELAKAKNFTRTAGYGTQNTGHFAKIIDYKSSTTKNHSLGVADKCMKMAKFYGFSDDKALRFYFAGAFHDIGKLIINNDILEKPGKLTTEEFRLL